MIDRFDPRLAAGDPVVMRQYLEQIARQHGITIRWSANPNEWCAKGKTATGPATVDKIAAIILAHELAHCIAGRCPRTGDHRAQIEGNVLACLACEAKAWEIAAGLLPFDRAMHERARAALQTYRESTPAPVSVQREADRFMGSVSWAQRHMAAQRMKERLAKQARANAWVEEQEAKRRKFAQLEARLKRARRS